MSPGKVVLLIVLLPLAVACESSPDDVQAVRVTGGTGSIPPPYTSTWEIQWDGEDTVAFRQTFLYRTDEQLADTALPQDVEGVVAIDQRLRARIESASISYRRRWPFSRPRLGGPWMEITLHTPHGSFTGAPLDEDEWRRIADDLGNLARRQLADPAPQPPSTP